MHNKLNLDIARLNTLFSDKLDTPQKLFESMPLNKGSAFVGGDFSNMYLVGVDFTGFNLSETNFSNANLAYANFSQCDLRGSNLRGANLSGATFVNTTIDEKTNVENCNLTRARAPKSSPFHPSKQSARPKPNESLLDFLFVEDQIEGIENCITFINDVFPLFDYKTVKTYEEGIEALHHERFAFTSIDAQIPKKSGEDSLVQNGIQLTNELIHNNVKPVDKDMKFAILTTHDSVIRGQSIKKHERYLGDFEKEVVRDLNERVYENVICQDLAAKYMALSREKNYSAGGYFL